jgi:hypothetical protein
MHGLALPPKLQILVKQSYSESGSTTIGRGQAPEEIGLDAGRRLELSDCIVKIHARSSAASPVSEKIEKMTAWREIA